ncbi:short chain dehydrogenase [Leptospira ryugenii]|uniref:Short chain dehydrogenase n=1 Tax=Leptospira ryugenii TaxID=1917863 RepID=A0A2P2E034_9LEPT|nr:SDR family NAD(P)-dependent oxidoreductase [Leptospira ryugenii]GBF50241.1 short chain dehydrogenase [Leptospira ryugenii]
MKKIIVVGASSGIGRAIAEAELKAGHLVLLLARRENELKKITAPWNSQKEKRALFLKADVSNLQLAKRVFQDALKQLGGLDEIFYASGTMPDVGPEEYNTEKDESMIQVNLLGAMAYLNQAAEYFAKQGKGTIVGISSIAGERGRKGNPGYFVSKAGLNTYLESLRNRLAVKNVTVITVKPGYVNTEMVKGLTLPTKGLLRAISAEEAAATIIEKTDKNKEVFYVPGIWSLVAFIIRNIPSFIFKKLNI